MNYQMILLTAAVVAVSNAAAQTKAYKCKVNGVLTFQQTPCDENASEKQEIEIITPKSSSDFTEREWELIGKQQVAIGMSEEALLRSWGRPDKVNRSGIGSDQWVYRRANHQNQYVYVKNGYVTNWSD